MAGVSGGGESPGDFDVSDRTAPTLNSQLYREQPYNLYDDSQDEIETDVPDECQRGSKRRKIFMSSDSSETSEEENSEQLEAELEFELAQMDNSGQRLTESRRLDDDSFEVVDEFDTRDPNAGEISNSEAGIIEIKDNSGLEQGETEMMESHLDSETDAKLQQVVEISDEETPNEDQDKNAQTSEHKHASDYRCPICFDPPEAALVTPCGHVFCTECLFQMVNSSRGYRRSGQCALCRKEVKFKDVRMIIMRKKRIAKQS